MPMRSAPAMKLDLPDVTMMPFTAASPNARSTAAANSPTNSCPITFMDLPGWSMVRVAMPSLSTAYEMLLVITALHVMAALEAAIQGRKLGA